VGLAVGALAVGGGGLHEKVHMCSSTRRSRSSLTFRSMCSAGLQALDGNPCKEFLPSTSGRTGPTCLHQLVSSRILPGGLAEGGDGPVPAKHVGSSRHRSPFARGFGVVLPSWF